MGKNLDLNNPKTFNEKIQWLKLYDRKPEYTQMVDKYEVKKYIKETIGSEYLVPLLGVYSRFDEIDFAALPNQFVIKPNHTSGDVYICLDKSAIDYTKLKKEVDQWIKKRYYWVHREWPYKDVKPKIICEKFMSEDNRIPDDYKVLCFNGKAKLIQLHRDRFSNYYMDWYDENWHKTNICYGIPVSDNVYEKPREFEKMIQLSEQLAAGMSHVRIDWYILKDKIYFGEITFFNQSGLKPFEADALLGSWINLPIDN